MKTNKIRIVTKVWLGVTDISHKLYNNESPLMLIEKLQIQVEAPSCANRSTSCLFCLFRAIVAPPKLNKCT